MKTFTHIGQAFRFVRLSLNMQQKDVADASGLSEGYIGNLERGDRDPSWSSVQAICLALQVPISFITMLMEADEEQVKPFLPMVYNSIWSKSREVEHVR